MRQNASNAIVVLLETSAIDEAKTAVIPETADEHVTADVRVSADAADMHVAIMVAVMPTLRKQAIVNLRRSNLLPSIGISVAHCL